MKATTVAIPGSEGETGYSPHPREPKKPAADPR